MLCSFDAIFLLANDWDLPHYSLQSLVNPTNTFVSYSLNHLHSFNKRINSLADFSDI